MFLFDFLNNLHLCPWFGTNSKNLSNCSASFKCTILQASIKFPLCLLFSIVVSSYFSVFHHSSNPCGPKSVLRLFFVRCSVVPGMDSILGCSIPFKLKSSKKNYLKSFISTSAAFDPCLTLKLPPRLPPPSLVIVNSKLLKHHSKAKRRAPAYSRALRQIRGVFQ